MNNKKSWVHGVDYFCVECHIEDMNDIEDIATWREVFPVWCKDNNIKPCGVTDSTMRYVEEDDDFGSMRCWFYNEVDATAFKLRWL